MPLHTSWGCLYQVHHACLAKENGESCGCYCHQSIQQNDSQIDIHPDGCNCDGRPKRTTHKRKTTVSELNRKVDHVATLAASQFSVDVQPMAAEAIETFRCELAAVGIAFTKNDSQIEKS